MSSGSSAGREVQQPQPQVTQPARVPAANEQEQQNNK